jgi:hypothetical protein
MLLRPLPDYSFACAVTLVAVFCFSSLPERLSVPAIQAQTIYASDLWGRAGEKWHPGSRLPDFSFAGYHTGDKALPTVPVIANVKDFGARGDGATDDTRAFKRAIAATNNGALVIPAGRYKITDVLEITKPNLVLRGAGEGQTTLFMARSLAEIQGATSLGQIPYGGGLLTVRGRLQGQQLAAVVTPANRGERRLVLSSTAGITAGQMIRLQMKNPTDNSLGCYLYANQGCLNAERQAWWDTWVDWMVQVQEVRGNTVTLVRPLRWDVRLEWAPSIWQFLPTVQEVGIEQLTIEFPNVQYGGHDHWAGYYAIYFEGVVHSWVRQVTIVDADRGIEVCCSHHNTITQATLTTKWRTQLPNPIGDPTTGHYGFAIGSLAQDNLVTESKIRTRFDHNMSVGGAANGNVFSSIFSASGRFDHHGAAPYENLYTEIVLTETASDLLTSGGFREDEPLSGARTTLWNVVSRGGNFPESDVSKFPLINVIGIDQWATQKTTGQAWFERWSGGLTSPPNLYEAQLQHRKGGQGTPPSTPPTPAPAPASAPVRQSGSSSKR